jgi:hypothetical protein
MNLSGKQRSSPQMARIYNYENRKNGGLGPDFFIKKFINNQINPNNIKKKYDLSIHVIFTNAIPNNLLSLITLIQQNISNLNIQKYFVNETNINSIKSNIKTDESRSFLILDNTTLQHFSDLNIPFHIYNANDANENNKLLSIIKSILFYKIEEKIENIKK